MAMTQEPKIAGTYYVYHVRVKFQGIYAPKVWLENLDIWYSYSS
jgi:hypothetical protein